MTVTIPAFWIILAAVLIAVALVVSRGAGPFRYLGGAALFLGAAYWLREPVGWTPLVLAVLGILCLLGFVDAVRAKK